MSSSAPRRRWVWPFLAAVVLLAACGGRPLLPGGGSTPGAKIEGDFHEAFVPGQTANWLLEQDASASAAIVNEQLVITITTPETIQYATLGDRVFGDFALEVDAWQRAGPPESSYGILFRMDDNHRFYRFEITGNGLFMVERHDENGVWTRLVPDWVPSPALNQGLNVANRLKIIAAGSAITFYANDVLLLQVDDATYASGAVALDAGTFAGGNLQVSFDNLTIAGSGQ